jgi:transcriptional regulator with PAS, ATPase and Fis domain
MRAIRAIIESIADTDATVLIRGESGVGKDLIARAIHAASARREGPFVKVNCAAIPAELLESELFGHEKDAFAGAHRRKRGQFEYAEKGTIYLAEIAELPLGLQGKLLHALQDFRFTRVGGHNTIDIGARVIASTNRDLEVAMARGEFREDLYYRLNMVEIRVPPLWERRDFRKTKRQAPDILSLFDRDPRMRVIRPIVQTVSTSDNPVLIHGDRAVDRDLVARAIHAMSPRRDGPFVKLNCAAIAPDLLESELFGSETDVFTGKHQRNPGQFENANKGTIFLDEIADLPLALQAKLLHMLRERRRTRSLGFWSLGSRGMIHVDTRVIAATNRDLEEAMKRGEFREELYYRLNVAEIRVPPPTKEDDDDNDRGPDQPTVPRHPVPVEAGGRLGRLKVRES